MSARAIKPLETVYRGYRFRSRLEARWAVFFDALEIEWEYETQGYKLPTRGNYLPDFWLPEFSGGAHVEVKPAGVLRDPIALGELRELAEEFTASMFASGRITEACLLLAVGLPEPYQKFCYRTFDDFDDGATTQCYDVAFVDKYVSKRREHRWYTSVCDPKTLDDHSVSLAAAAASAARQARFEHGQIGAPEAWR